MHLSHKEWIIYWSNPIQHSDQIPKSYEISSDIAVPNHTGIGHLGWAVLAQGRVQQIIIISSFCLQNRTNSDSNGWLHQLQPSWISTIPHTIQNWQVGWQLFLKIWVSNQTFISRFDMGSDQNSPEMEPKPSLIQSPVTEIPPGRSIN